MARKGMLNTTSRKVNKDNSRVKALLCAPVLTAFAAPMLVGVFSLWSMMSVPYLPDIPPLVESQTAQTDIFASIQFAFEDRSKTEQFRKEALRDVPRFYRVSPKVPKLFDSNFSEAASELEKRTIGKSGAYGYTAAQTPVGSAVRELPEESFAVISEIFRDKRLKDLVYDKLHANVLNGIIDSDSRDALPGTMSVRITDSYGRTPVDSHLVSRIPIPREVSMEAVNSILPHFSRTERDDVVQKAGAFFETLVKDCLLEYDRSKTDEAMKAARRETIKSVPPVMIEVPMGQVIIKGGSRVGKKDLEVLACYREAVAKAAENASSLEANKLAMHVFSVLVILLFSIVYISHIHPEIVSNNRDIWFLAVLTTAAIALNILAAKSFNVMTEQFPLSPHLLFLAMPFAFAPVVISSVYGMRSALFAGLYISLVAAFSCRDSFNMIILGMFVSGLSAFMVKPCVNYRSHFIVSFFTIALSTVGVGAVLCLRNGFFGSLSLFRPETFEELRWFFVLPVFNALVTTVCALVAIFILESVFDATTNMSLLLYSDYNHPLLKRLQIEAPGTYHHSLVVSILAETAAQEIGADPIKARVAALFHDVGKLVHPEYFTENSGGEDKHKDLKPKISAMIILGHVKEGLALAKQYKLKKLMRDAISRHHGTGLVYFFYKRAKDSGEMIDENDYRYQGPLPETPEIAILLLADACEAASRSLEKPTHGKIDELVSEIILKRLRDRQLDDCRLTFRDLSIIRESFVRTLTSMLHARVAYPKDEEKNNEDDLFLAAAAKKSAQTQDS